MPAADPQDCLPFTQPMKTALALSRNWLKVTAIILASLAAVLGAQAQTGGTGTVQGRVYNPATKQYIRNAEVRLEGSQQVVYSENDGSFQLLNVPAGEAKVTVNYSGYTPATETFTVAAGQTAVREINL